MKRYSKILAVIPFILACQCALAVSPIAVKDENALIRTDRATVQMRDAYVRARTLAKAGNVSAARAIQRDELQGYPLNIWIDYYCLSGVPSLSKLPEVKKFLDSGEHHELSERLRDKYIKFLSKGNNHKAMLQVLDSRPEYDESKPLTAKQTSRLCHYYEASWALKRDDSQAAAAFASSLYSSLKSYPDECSGLISMWRQHGYLTHQLREEKFENAYAAPRSLKLTRLLADQLKESSSKDLVKGAMALYEKPQGLFKLGNGSRTSHKIAVLAFTRLASINGRDAAARFNEFVKKFSPTEAEKIAILQKLAYTLTTRQSSPEDLAWIDQHLPMAGWTDSLREQRLRRALWYSQWKKAAVLIDQLPAASREDINWQYWKARSLMKLGKKSEGSKLMHKVAEDRSFFGFLAAQELGIRAAYNHKDLNPQARWPETVAGNVAVRRFFELYAMDDRNASIEWQEIAKTAPEDEAMMMAEWALMSGNVQYAIQIVVGGARWDALKYRFPAPYMQYYRKYSQNYGLSLSFLYGISRQESMMNPGVRSPVGAIGLMQLMPATAKVVARKNKWKYKGPRELINPEINIRYGSAYLNDMMNRFGHNRILAAAAYNAGPNRIKQWSSKDGVHRDTAMFVENIPFNETRKYVQNVLLYDAIYNKLLTGKETQLLKGNELSYNY